MTGQTFTEKVWIIPIEAFKSSSLSHGKTLDLSQLSYYTLTFVQVNHFDLFINYTIKQVRSLIPEKDDAFPWYYLRHGGKI